MPEPTRAEAQKLHHHQERARKHQLHDEHCAAAFAAGWTGAPPRDGGGRGPGGARAGDGMGRGPVRLVSLGAGSLRASR